MSSSNLNDLLMGAFQVALVVKNLPANARYASSIPGWEDPPQEAMLTHSSILPCKIPWTEEPGGLHTVWGVEKS